MNREARTALATQSGAGMLSSSEQRFQELLLQYSQEPDPQRRGELERQLWADYGMRQAVLVLDMSGFSSLTDRYGVVHYLSMVRRMQLTADPIIRSFGGVLIKFEADNGFAMFPDVEAALRAALALNLAFDAANRMTPDELDIRIACGIDVGDILVIDRGEFFGDAVNRASKLGEDLAEPGEILVTAGAFSALPANHRWVGQARELSISGIRIAAFSLRVAEQEAALQ